MCDGQVPSPIVDRLIIAVISDIEDGDGALAADLPLHREAVLLIGGIFDKRSGCREAWSGVVSAYSRDRGSGRSVSAACLE